MDSRTIIKKFDDLLFLLVLVVCAELFVYLFFPEVARTHHTMFHLIDVVVLIAFSMEVFLRYFEYHDLKRFLREHWMSILALFLAMGATRILRAARVGALLAEEETVISGMLPRSSRLVEMPVILGKVGKIGAYAQRKRRINHMIENCTKIGESKPTNLMFYSPIELKEMRDAIIR